MNKTKGCLIANFATVPKLVASNNPPLRLILGSMVYDLAMDTLKARMATWEEWEAVSRASEKAIPAPERYGV
ncbi:hypothetical protein MZH09_22590 [Escherichia coli]|nr:hypothetical protein [Escherichia coli]